MSRCRATGLLAALALLAGCDGPREDAGEQADATAGIVSGEDTPRTGPAERAGEAQDRVVATATDAREAQDRVVATATDAREARADADEERADTIRSTADRAADALDDRAAATRGR